MPQVVWGHVLCILQASDLNSAATVLPRKAGMWMRASWTQVPLSRPKGCKWARRKTGRWAFENEAGSALSELFKVLDSSQLQVCQVPKRASNTLLVPCKESRFTGSTKKKTGPMMIKFPVCDRCFVHWPHLVPTTPVSHGNHYPITYSLVHWKSSTYISYYCCCHHSCYKWRE